MRRRSTVALPHEVLPRISVSVESQFKMGIPVVSPRIEERDNRTRIRINTVDVTSFLVIAVPATESEVRIRISATCLFRL
jgi:hypothetical protein